jgi:TolB-like protein/Tfp pilus assembly protein PilF
VAWQNDVAAQEAETDEDRRFQFRIGINLGDVIVEGDDIYGDGVNIAARMEALAEPGSICMSRTVVDHVKGKVELDFEDIGEQNLKNVAEPVSVYRIAGDRSSIGAASPTKAPLPLQDKPSIAVLPFTNISGDPEQEYFADGITEDIITALSRFHQFFVIARNSSFTYKGKAVDVKQVARELGVQYVIEGSVRRAGNRVRITAQLIDAASGNHIWAERYDRELDDIFAVQDEITERIAMTVGPELDTTEMVRAHRKSLPDLGVWELLARANWHGLKFTECDVGLAKSLCVKALEIDPDNARIYASLSACYAIDAAYGWRRPLTESHAMALELAEKAVALDKEDERTHLRLGAALLLAKRHEEAIQRYRTAIKLNPNYSIALGQLGMVLVWAHKHDEALELLHKAMQLSPKDGNLIWYIIHVGWHHFIEKRYDEAHMWAEKALYEEPKFPSGVRLKASAQGMLGNLAEARVAYELFDEIVPGATIAAMVEAIPFAYEDDAQRFAEGLRRAGMPEE